MTPRLLTDWLLVTELAPDATDALAPLYAGADAGRLCLPHCAACCLTLELEQRVCDGCGGTEVAWRAVEPAGWVHSVTVVHRREPGLVLTEEPYPVADVELAGGHRLVLGPLSPDVAPPAIGDPVAVGFRRLGEVAVPGFTPAVSPRPDPPGSPGTGRTTLPARPAKEPSPEEAS